MKQPKEDNIQKKYVFKNITMATTNLTRMTTSISSEARRKQTLSWLGAEKITFPPKPDGQTGRDRQTGRQTDGH